MLQGYVGVPLEPQTLVNHGKNATNLNWWVCRISNEPSRVSHSPWHSSLLSHPTSNEWSCERKRDASWRWFSASTLSSFPGVEKLVHPRRTKKVGQLVKGFLGILGATQGNPRVPNINLLMISWINQYLLIRSVISWIYPTPPRTTLSTFHRIPGILT